MANTTTPFQEVDHWFRQFAREFVASRQRDVLKADLQNTEFLLQSLYAKVISEPQRGLFLMTFFAANYGRYQDMRRRYGKVGGSDMEQALEEWAANEGADKFRKGKYTGIYGKMPTQRMLNRIAWGIINKYRLKSPRKRGWYNRGKTRDIEDFYDLLLRVWRDAVLAETKQAFTQ